MLLSERAFDAMTRFPQWLESFDALQIPGWGVLFIMGLSAMGLVFAVREFLSWFLKTNAIIDEVLRLETLVRDLQGDLSALEATVERLQLSTGTTPSPKLESQLAGETEIKPQAKKDTAVFRLNH